MIYTRVLQRLRHGRSFSLSFLSAPHKAPYHELLPCEHNRLETAETERQPVSLLLSAWPAYPRLTHTTIPALQKPSGSTLATASRDEGLFV